MDAFLFAIGAVMPLILIVALGYLLKRVGLFPVDLGRRVNKIVFKILIPATVFLNIYKIDDLMEGNRSATVVGCNTVKV